MGLEGLFDLATSSWLQFSFGIICCASSKCPDLSTERFSSSQRQLNACSVFISHLIVLALVLVPRDDVLGSVSKENAQFMLRRNFTKGDNQTSGNWCRRVMWGCKTIAVMSWMLMRYSFRNPGYVDIERAIEYFPTVWRRTRDITQKGLDTCLENVNRGEAFFKDKPACHGMSC
jgi:hypothetical protein